MWGCVVLLGICSCLLFLCLNNRRPKKFPPGPRALPLFGNLLDLNLVNPLNDLKQKGCQPASPEGWNIIRACASSFLRLYSSPLGFPSGSHSFLHRTKLSEQYGEVFSVFIGMRPVVVINGVEAIKDALVTRSLDFAGRPHDLMVNHLTANKGLILADYGSAWKEHRRFALTTLKHFGMGTQAMEERILGELSFVISMLEKSVGHSVDSYTMVRSVVSNIMLMVLFGNRYEYGDETLQIFIKLYTENAKIANGPWAMIYDGFPLLRNLPLPFQKALNNASMAKKLCRKLVDEHKKTRVPGQPRHFVDCYLDELDKILVWSSVKRLWWSMAELQGSGENQRGDDGSSFEETRLIMNILDLHFGGTDSTSNPLLTAFLYLSTNPDIQERCYQEISGLLEGKPHVCFEDRHQMPYTQAVVREAQRVANSLPLGVFHSTTKDTQLRGYDIPKGTVIIPNLSSALFEEGRWKFPDEFNPSNFLNEEGELEKPEAFIPFSAGPRMCLGENLARMEHFLILVTLLRHFKFSWPEDAGDPDFTPIFGLTMTPKPYCMTVSLRTT